MPARTGRPPKISRADIVTAANRVIEESGLEGLTMRRLAREVGSTAMALYHHVQNKEELLLLLLDDYTQSWPRPEELPEEPRECVVAVAIAMREMLAGCPWIVDVLRADDLLSVGALWYPEKIVDAAVTAGLTVEAAIDAYRIIWHYTAGEVGVRAAARRRRVDGTTTHREMVFAELDKRVFPRLATVGRQWEMLTAKDTYDQGLRALVTGLLP